MSLRFRVLAGIAVVAVVLVVAAVAVTRSTEQYLIDQVDDRLRTTPNVAFGGFRGSGPGFPGFSDGPGRFSEVYIAVLDDQGQVVAESIPDLGDEATPTLRLDTDAVLGLADETLFTLSSDDPEASYRALVRRGTGPVAGTRIVVALPLSGVQDAVDRLVAIEVVATLATLAVLGLVAWWVVRLGVRPVKDMTASATVIAGGDLSERVPDGRAGTEAGELSAALNQMLGRIESAFDERERSQERLRQFVADASHELRTPVTTIRGYAELYRTGALHGGDKLSEAMRRTEQEAIRMGALVEDLLQLARLDQGRALDRAPVDLVAIAEDAARDARAVDPDRPISVSCPDGNRSVVVTGDDARLRQVVANLVGNALVHTPGHAAVLIDVGVDDTSQQTWIEVIDQGPGMDPEVAARVLERFYRADPSRSRHKGGTGLGLSIVEATVGAHGGTVAVTSHVGVGTSVRIELPTGING